eukprot:403337428
MKKSINATKKESSTDFESYIKETRPDLEQKSQTQQKQKKIKIKKIKLNPDVQLTSKMYKESQTVKHGQNIDLNSHSAVQIKDKLINNQLENDENQWDKTFNNGSTNRYGESKQQLSKQPYIYQKAFEKDSNSQKDSLIEVDSIPSHSQGRQRSDSLKDLKSIQLDIQKQIKDMQSMFIKKIEKLKSKNVKTFNLTITPGFSPSPSQSRIVSEQQLQVQPNYKFNLDDIIKQEGSQNEYSNPLNNITSQSPKIDISNNISNQQLISRNTIKPSDESLEARTPMYQTSKANNINVTFQKQPTHKSSNNQSFYGMVKKLTNQKSSKRLIPSNDKSFQNSQQQTPQSQNPDQIFQLTQQVIQLSSLVMTLQKQQQEQFQMFQVQRQNEGTPSTGQQKLVQEASRKNEGKYTSRDSKNKQLKSETNLGNYQITEGEYDVESSMFSMKKADKMLQPRPIQTQNQVKVNLNKSKVLDLNSSHLLNESISYPNKIKARLQKGQEYDGQVFGELLYKQYQPSFFDIKDKSDQPEYKIQKDKRDKIKNYWKRVNDSFLPPIDLKKKTELNDRIMSLKSRSRLDKDYRAPQSHHSHSRSQPAILNYTENIDYTRVINARYKLAQKFGKSIALSNSKSKGSLLRPQNENISTSNYQSFLMTQNNSPIRLIDKKSIKAIKKKRVKLLPLKEYEEKLNIKQ